MSKALFCNDIQEKNRQKAGITLDFQVNPCKKKKLDTIPSHAANKSGRALYCRFPTRTIHSTPHFTIRSPRWRIGESRWHNTHFTLRPLSMSIQNLQPATLPRRLAAILYDLILLSAVLFVASIPVVVGFRITYGGPYYGYYQAYLFVLSFLYFGWFWVHGGRTLGMTSWGVRLVSTRYPTITWPQALLRFVFAIISWLALGLGFFWSLLRSDHATWHDLISETTLIREIQ
jgi:uncharacterized RDD family membrane protein YckC